jgi:hypothetical protein
MHGGGAHREQRHNALCALLWENPAGLLSAKRNSQNQSRFGEHGITACGHVIGRGQQGHVRRHAFSGKRRAIGGQDFCRCVFQQKMRQCL